MLRADFQEGLLKALELRRTHACFRLRAYKSSPREHVKAGTIWVSAAFTLAGLPSHWQHREQILLPLRGPPAGLLSGSKFSHGFCDPLKELEGIALHPPELTQTLGEQGGCSEGAGKRQPGEKGQG